MADDNKPQRNVSWRVLGAMAAHFRRQSDYTQASLAEYLHTDPETIGSMEQGRRLLQPRMAATLDELFETGGLLSMSLAKIPKRERYPAFAIDFITHERDAESLFSYQNSVIPGLLQTPEYAAAVFGCLYPPLTPEEIEVQTATRLARQTMLARKPWPPMMHYILEQSVLERPIGGREVLMAQLRHLRELTDLPFLGLQIMPTGRESHAGLAGPMVLLETGDHDQLAYLEGQGVSFLLDDPEEVHPLNLKYGILRNQALSMEDSRGLLDDLLGES
ncbi:helix-turn-helix transcriptional regulator [Streptomyces sp. ISL-43]|uniref:helix-turn-helix domain-containing protein n=1 Tax=Streptomyces sp. ISL-43 TaxID=2819183 RepID=UPI001BECD844|nr:helix-turn-helix transcriptional regulator [Streptomyces sp. ISL-43]MBT2451663.1 helix-turn-helix transcriptional regulator [Streptomyces sp. ISL-43]